MTVTPCTVIIRPRDPLIARSARPFNADPGSQAETLPWPLPTTTAGALRTHIVSTAPSFTSWDDGEAVDRAVKTMVHGPLLLARRQLDAAWTPYLSAPLDAVIDDDPDAGPRIVGLRPLSEQAWQADRDAGAGANLPHPGLVPLHLTRDVKARPGPAFWSLDDTVAWLTRAAGDNMPEHQLPPLPVETRTHVAIDPTTQAGAEGLLYSTSGLVFQDEPSVLSDRLGAMTNGGPALAMACRVRSAVRDWVKDDAIVPLGGERRLAGLEFPKRDADDPWPALVRYPDLVQALTGTEYLRLQLVTPALFGARPPAPDGAARPGVEGWLPGWLDPETLTGLPDGLEDLAPLQFRLVAAAIGRRVAVSGWSLRDRRGRATRYAAPAGSVYFFRIEHRPLPAQAIQRLWLRSVSDWLQARRDGFGLVLPGIWHPAQ